MVAETIEGLDPTIDKAVLNEIVLLLVIDAYEIQGLSRQEAVALYLQEVKRAPRNFDTYVYTALTLLTSESLKIELDLSILDRL